MNFKALNIIFNSIDIEEQVNYFNEKLKEGATIINICKEIGIGRSTISDRFKKKASYIYDKDINR